MMLKTCVIFIVLVGCGLVNAEPEPKATADAKAGPKPGVLAYNAPILAPGLAYSAAYTSPLAYSAPYVAPYAAGYAAYSPYVSYSAPLVVV